jgi:hypothetical protein
MHNLQLCQWATSIPLPGSDIEPGAVDNFGNLFFPHPEAHRVGRVFLGTPAPASTTLTFLGLSRAWIGLIQAMIKAPDATYVLKFTETAQS